MRKDLLLRGKIAMLESTIKVNIDIIIETKTLAVTCHSAKWNTVGHDNRVFCLKFINDNLLISGGWDSVVHIWDIR